MLTSDKIEISRAFRNYLELKGYHRIPKSTHVTKRSVISTVKGIPHLKDFSHISRHPDISFLSIVKLYIKDFNCEEITNGLFKINL